MANDSIKPGFEALLDASKAYVAINAKTIYGHVKAVKVGDHWVHIDQSKKRIWAGNSARNLYSLGFTVGKGGSAGGRFVTHDGEIWLAHKGHLGGNSRPVKRAELTSRIRGFDLYDTPERTGRLVLVCDTGGIDSLERIQQFAQECDRIRAELFGYREPTAPKPDLGPSKGGERRECVFSARQHPVAKELKGKLESLHWSVKPQSSSLRPDLLMQKKGITGLIEVKPTSHFHDAVTGIGQLIVYSHGCPADCRALVMQKMSGVSSKIIETVARREGIHLIWYKETNGEIVFSDLSLLEMKLEQ